VILTDGGGTLKLPNRSILFATAIVAIGAVTVFPATRGVSAAHPQAGVSGKIGFAFSDFTTSARWKFDESFFKAALKKLDPNVQVLVTDGKASQTTQQQQATSLLTRGVKLLIDVPVADASPIVRLAHNNSPRVKVLAYDRLILGAQEDAYASFNGYTVGVQQGTFIKNHVAKGGTIIEIAGSPTDNNAHLFHAGALSVLQPLITSGYYSWGYQIFTPNWDDATAQKECASALTKLNNKVNGVLVANDGMAVACIQSLKAQGLAGKIPITGQDATTAGLQQILLGNQSMTVYKPLKPLATAAAHIVDIWLHGKTLKANHACGQSATSTASNPCNTATKPGKTPSVIIGVKVVTKSNIKSTVLKDGFVKRADLCAGIASACAAAGI
jgi:D-xylose transport system substrate-binding protein